MTADHDAIRAAAYDDGYARGHLHGAQSRDAEVDNLLADRDALAAEVERLTEQHAAEVEAGDLLLDIVRKLGAELDTDLARRAKNIARGRDQL